MATFSVHLEIGDVTATRFEAVDATIDTGSIFSTVPGDILDRLGVQRTRHERFEVASGDVVENDVGDAIIRVDGKQSASPVIFGKPGEPTLLGAVSLESLLLGVDPTHQRLIPILGIRDTRLPAP